MGGWESRKGAGMGVSRAVGGLGRPQSDAAVATPGVLGNEI